MIKLTFCLRRRVELDGPAFQSYWLDVHAPLVRSRLGALQARRYVQVHTSFPAVGRAMAAFRGTPEPFDGVAELWYERLEDLLEAGRSAAGRAAAAELLEDERRFIDLSRSPMFLGVEHEIYVST